MTSTDQVGSGDATTTGRPTRQRRAVAGVMETFDDFRSAQEIHALLTKPIGYTSGQRYPTLLRLHGGPRAAWPRRVQLSTATGWRTVDTIAMPPRGRCQRVFASNYLRPTLFALVGGPRGVQLTVRPGGPDGWRLVRTPNRY